MNISVTPVTSHKRKHVVVVVLGGRDFRCEFLKVDDDRRIVIGRDPIRRRDPGRKTRRVEMAKVQNVALSTLWPGTECTCPNRARRALSSYLSGVVALSMSASLSSRSIQNAVLLGEGMATSGVCISASRKGTSLLAIPCPFRADALGHSLLSSTRGSVAFTNADIHRSFSNALVKSASVDGRFASSCARTASTANGPADSFPFAAAIPSAFFGHLSESE